MKKVIITSGYFNPIHSGHINLLKEARALGDFLVVIVNNDAQAKIKGSVEFMPEQERLEIVKSVKYVDEALLSVDKDGFVPESLKMVAKKYPDAQLFFAKGGDRNFDNLPESEKAVCRELNIQIINHVGGGKVQSSSWLIQNVVNAFLSIKKIPNAMKTFSSIEVMGNKIDMVQIPDVIGQMDFWIQERKNPLTDSTSSLQASSGQAHWIVATGMHGVMEARKNKEFQGMLATADMWAADGISLVWMARLNGFNLKKRVAGPDLFHAFLKHAVQKGYKSYFYGDTDETLAKLGEKLNKELLGSKFESFSPPFRKLTPEEDAKIIENINAAKPDVLWIGLGLPKQEKWIFEHRAKLQVPVIVGVGAAFKFEAGIVNRAPTWMGNAGFEWLHRLFQEPKRVWRRVFVDAPQFIWFASLDFLKHKNAK